MASTDKLTLKRPSHKGLSNEIAVMPQTHVSILKTRQES